MKSSLSSKWSLLNFPLADEATKVTLQERHVSCLREKWQVRQRRATDLTEVIKNETTNRGTCTGNPNDPEDSPRTYIPEQAPETAEWRCQIPDAKEYKLHLKRCLFQARKFIHCVTVYQRHPEKCYFMLVLSCPEKWILSDLGDSFLLFKKSFTSLKLTHALRAYTLTLLVPQSYFS